MTVILDINEKNAESFMELINNLDYIKLVSAIKSDKKGKAVKELINAFNDVKLYEAQKINLKKAKDLLNEL